MHVYKTIYLRKLTFLKYMNISILGKFINIGNYFLTIPTNTEFCGHCFSALRRLKTYLRIHRIKDAKAI